MKIDWPLVTILVVLCLPGAIIAIPKLIHFLLKDNSLRLKRRLCILALSQLLIMVFIMSMIGSLVSSSTSLSAPILSPLLNGEPIQLNIQDSLLPVFSYVMGGLIVYLILYYGLFERLVDEHNKQTVQTVRRVIGLDGCMLYSGIVDEVLARFGLMNVIAFFGFLFFGVYSDGVIWTSILASSILLTLAQLPAYLAAGCKASRTFLYTFMLLNLWQSILFGFIFWHYGLLMTFFAHMLFHLGWWLYDRPNVRIMT